MVTGSKADALPMPSSRINIRPSTSRRPTGAEMTARIPENVSPWLLDWSIVTIMGNTMPPRDPEDDDINPFISKRTILDMGPRI
jgi:hypothetical protein